MKNPWVIVGIITVVLFGGAIWYANVSAERNNEGITITEQIKGNPEAPVVLVEYSDFQCPACAAFQPYLAEVMAQYGDRIQLQYKHFPLPIHASAIPAAVAAEAAGQQGKFFEYHDLLFANQTEWSTAVAPQALFLTYAEELGLDMDTFRRHMRSSLLRDHVRASVEEGRGLGITGTPTFFLNGQRMQVSTYEDFMTQIAAAVDPGSVTVDGATTTAPAASDIRFGL